MTTMIPKGERDELRRIVRGDFKALHGEVEVRRAELLAEIEQQVATRFEPHEFALNEANEKLLAIVNETNRRLGALAAELQEKCSGYKVDIDKVYSRIELIREQRNEIRRAAIADLDARVRNAKARMQRQEVDLLKQLSIGALGSTEAHDFLKTIPTVAELVPASRLMELEAGLEEAGQ